jgi:hypothetical protein
MYYSQVEISELVLNHPSVSKSELVIMMSKIVKAIDVEVNKRLELYLLAFIKYNYENGPEFPEGSDRPSDEEIEGHISSYMKLNPFSLEEKVVEKKRMGRPKKNEKETVVNPAVEDEMFGNLNGNVSEMKLEHPDNVAPVVGKKGPKEKKEKAVKVAKEKVPKAAKEEDEEVEGEKVEKAPKAKKEKVVKEKVVKEKVEKAPKEKKEKVVKEKKEKVVKEKKAKVAKAVKNDEEENPWAIEDDGEEKSPKEKVKKAPKAKKEKVVKEGEEGGKKRGRPKKNEVKEEEKVETPTSDEDSEEVAELAVELNELCQVSQVPIVEEQSKQAGGSQQHLDDEVAFEEYDEFEEDAPVESPKTEVQDHIVKFTDKSSGKDYFIDKQMAIENEEAPQENWYAVKDATTRAVVGRSNLRQMELFDEDDDDEDEEEEEEEEEDDDEDDDEED